MHVIDLTHEIHSGMPVFPGTPPVRIHTANTLDEHGFEERLVSMSTHTGTHMDNPSHVLRGQGGLDTVSPERFMGPACLLDARGKTEITENDLVPLEASLERADFLILRTGWQEKWGTPAYFSGFPVLTRKAARYLAGFGLKGVGVDAISMDRMEDEELPIHRILLGHNILIIENLTNVGELPREGFYFTALPLRIRHGDGSPVRALAVIN
ncbi:cyclase family protein [Desulfoplanes formicivorans]|uniref:Hydrolase n=1 Tax=Desulfoplanes formicivorans TaxID=1592317 RepID=A0A194AK54_9BACT|nr:cyclase family protein [Desulfoplanes formicivorans]GAU09099.1 hydrolase [Desulfoplanes formicivorans]